MEFLRIKNDINPYNFLKLVLVLYSFCILNPAIAQQTIISVPSSEILPAGDIILKNSNRFRPFYPDGYVTISPSSTIGIGHGMEISSAISTTLNGETRVRGDFSAKKVWFLGPSARITLGGTISPYMSQRSHPDSFVYTHFSHRIKETKTSLTAGGYLHGSKSVPDKAGVILGMEQVIIPNKLRLAFDWMSSQDSMGKIGVGLKYRPVPTLSITSAVIIPNKDNDNIAFNLSVSKFISLDNENPIKRRLTNVD